MTSIAPKAFLTSRIATEAMETPPVTRPFRAPSEARPPALFASASKRLRRNGGAGRRSLRLEAIIGAISIARSLQMQPDPRRESRCLAQKPPWHLASGAAAVKRHQNLARIPVKWSERERIDGNVLMLRPAGLKPVSPHE
jgi:hypothetical protein